MDSMIKLNLSSYSEAVAHPMPETSSLFSALIGDKPNQDSQNY